MKFLTVASAAIVLTQAVVSREACAAPATNTLVSTISASRQFAAYANDRVLPSALCVYAERVKREWLRRLDIADQWRDPILIVVRSREPLQKNAPPILFRTFQTETHLKYQIYCLMPPPLDESELMTAMVEALCAEWANRAQPTGRGQAYMVPVMPLWLVQGLASEIQGRNDLLLAVARRSIAAGRPQTASDLLDTKRLPSDPAERVLFQANAWMFTESLLVLPDGPQKLRRFLWELGAQKSASNAFWTVYRQHFPQDNALEKWWSLQQVGRTAVAVAENLTAQDTAQQLDEILLTKLGATGGRRGMPGDVEITVDHLWHYTDEPWLQDVLKLKIDRLGALRSRANPFYQPAIDQYLEAVNWLAQRNITRFRRAMAKAASAQAAAGKRSQATTAYLDQAERTYAPEELSKIFTGYFHTLDQSQSLNQQRHSPISDYLDKFDH